MSAGPIVPALPSVPLPPTPRGEDEEPQLVDESSQGKITRGLNGAFKGLFNGIESISGNSLTRRATVGVVLFALGAFPLAHLPICQLGFHGMSHAFSWKEQLESTLPFAGIIAVPGVGTFLVSKYVLKERGLVSEETHERFKTFATMSGAVAVCIIAIPVIQDLNQDMISSMTRGVSTDNSIKGTIFGAIGATFTGFTTLQSIQSGIPTDFNDPKQLISGIGEYPYLLLYGAATLGSTLMIDAGDKALGKKSKGLRYGMQALNTLIFTSGCCFSIMRGDSTGIFTNWIDLLFGAMEISNGVIGSGAESRKPDFHRVAAAPAA